jgi:hypothetical protein
MDKLVPLNISIRQDQLQKKQEKQREQMNQHHINQHFDGGVST